MSINKSALEKEIIMLSLLGTRDKDRDGRPLSDTLQVSERFSDKFELNLATRIFATPAVVHCYSMLRRYRTDMGVLPALRSTFENYLLDKVEHYKFTQEASVQDQDIFLRCVSEIFRPVADKEYYLKLIESLFAQKFVKMQMEEVLEGVKQVGGSGRKAIADAGAEAIKTLRDLEYVLHGDTYESVSLEEFDQLDYSEAGGISTYVPGFNLYQDGLTMELAAGKMGKTRLAIKKAYEKLKQGYNVAYFDVENGKRNIAARFLMCMLSEYLGYPVPMKAIESDVLLNHEWAKNKGYITSASKVDYIQIDAKVLRVRYIKEVTDREGVKKEQWTALLDTFTALQNDVVYSDLPDEDFSNAYFEYRKTFRADQGGAWWNSTRLLVKKMNTSGFTNSFGDLKVVFDRKLKPSRVREILSIMRDERPGKGWDAPWGTIIYLDWMSHIQPDGRHNSTWEGAKAKYAQFRTLQSEEQVYVCCIAAVSNQEECRKMDADVARIKTAETTQIGLDAVAAWVILQGPEEKNSRCFRFTPYMDRHGGSTVFMRSDADFTTVNVIPHNLYAELNPETWQHLTSMGEHTNPKSKVNYQEESDDILGDLLG